MSFSDHITSIEHGLSLIPSLLDDLRELQDNDGKISWEEGLMIGIKAILIGLGSYAEDIKQNKD